MIITDRNRCCFKRFSIDGKYLETISLPGANVCRPVIKGDYLYAAVLTSGSTGNAETGFVIILDKDNKLISAPGGSTPAYDGKCAKKVIRQFNFSSIRMMCWWMMKAVFTYVNGTVDRSYRINLHLMFKVIHWIFLCGLACSGFAQPLQLSQPKTNIHMAMVSKDNPQNLILDFRMVNTDIRFTQDGAEPTIKSKRYRKPIKVSKPTIIKAKVFHKDFASSETITATFVDRGKDFELQYIRSQSQVYWGR